MLECNPNEYLLKEDHDRQCERGRKAAMEWAHDAVAAGKEDREKLWKALDKIDDEVIDLGKLVPRFQWYFIAILISILITSYVMPKLTGNGTHKTLEDLTTKMNIVVDKQAAFDTILNDVRADQKRRELKEGK